MRRNAMFAAAVFSFCCATHGQTPPVYNETFEIEKQVDVVRYVQSATVTNNARGDFILEFMATRDPNPRERWTVTYENDANFKFVQHVDVDGVRRYSAKSAIVGQEREVTLITPTASATFAVVCLVVNLEPYALLAAQTAADRLVVAGVVTTIKEQMEGQDPPPPNPNYDQCVANCGTMPVCTVPAAPEDVCECVDYYRCCLRRVDWVECVGHCHCTWLNPPDPLLCEAAVGVVRNLGEDYCFFNLHDCIINTW